MKKTKLRVDEGWGWLGFIILFIALSISYCIWVWLFYKPIVWREEKGNLLNAMWNELANTFTIATAIVCAICDLLAERMAQKKKWNKRVIAIGVFIFFYYCRCAVAIDISLQLYTIVSCIIYCISILLVAVVSYNTYVFRSADKGWLKAVLGKIRNQNFGSIQLYEVEETVENGIKKYHFQYVDGMSREGYDVNGIISQTYYIDEQYINKFKMVLLGYDAYVENGEESQKNIVLKAIDDNRKELIDSLNSINSLDLVTKKECCMARLYLLYNRIQGVLEKPSGDALMMCDKLGLNDSLVEEKLFSTYRTGMLGAVLLGTKDIYAFEHFDADRTTPKTGRKYCAFQIDIKKSQKKFICLVVIRERTNEIMITIDLIKAIRNIESKIKEELNTSGIVVS